MAKITGPLHSDSASGGFAGSIVFATWKGIAYARSLVIPSNPKSAGQTGVRAMMRWLSKHWAGMPALSKESWETIADSRNISPFNAFVGESLDAWQANNTPTNSYPGDHEATSLAADAVGDDGVILAASGGNGFASLSATPDTTGATDAIGVCIFRNSAAPTGLWNLCVAVLDVFPGTQVTFVDSPLNAGTYHYKLRYFSNDGSKGALSAADVTAVVT